MSKSGESVSSRQYLQSLRRHVTSPPQQAMTDLKREQAEIRAEKWAFEAFAERVIAAEPETASWCPAEMVVTEPSSDIKRIRDAYQDTVMSTDHYPDVYDNTLRADMASEFGPGIAATLDSATQFTNAFRDILIAATEESVVERATVLKRLDHEQASIAAAYDELLTLVNNIDSTCIPEWYRSTFTDRLDRLADQRQKTIRSHRSLGQLDGHSLCQYVYAGEPWIYPVLTAIGRLREVIIL